MNTLWAYERDYAVRQDVLYRSNGTSPEDYCLREGGMTSNILNTSLTAAGAHVFDYLKPTASIPIRQSYVYHTGCAASTVLSAGSDEPSVPSTSTDGRERLEEGVRRTFDWYREWWPR